MSDETPPLILHVLPDLAVGGGQVLLRRTIGAMDPHRYRHAVLSIGTDETMRVGFESVGARVLVLGSASRLAGATPGRRVVELARPLAPAIVHTNNTGPDRAVGQRIAISLGVPAINTVHSVYSPPRPARSVREMGRECARRARRASEARSARRCLTMAVGVSSHVRETWLDAFARQGVTGERFRVIHPGLDLSVVDRDADWDAARRLLSIADDETVVLCVTRLVDGKGVEDLIEITPRLLSETPRLRVLIAGDGEKRNDLERRARDLGVDARVSFLGRRDDVPSLLAGADLFVFPSYSEGFGLAPLEAMAARTPVVAYDLPAYRDFLRDADAGRLAHFHDRDALAAATVALLRDPQRRRAMGARGRSIVEDRFTAVQSARRLADLYDEVLGSRGER